MTLLGRIHTLPALHRNEVCDTLFTRFGNVSARNNDPTVAYSMFIIAIVSVWKSLRLAPLNYNVSNPHPDLR